MLLLASLAVLPIPVSADAKTITVPDDYPTIQEAIDQADSGDTVYVKAGNYSGTVEVNKSIALIGENNQAVISDWVITGKAAILVTHSNVTVSGMTIDNPEYVNMWIRKRGIHLLGASGCTITNNIVRHCDSGDVEGIWLYQSQNNYVANNLVENCSVGISIGNSQNNQVINNKVRNNYDEAIYLYQSSGNTITQNSLESVKVGFQLTDSDYNSFVANNVSASTQGIVFQVPYYSLQTQATGNLFLHNNFFAATPYPYVRVCQGLWGNPLDTQYSVVGTNYFDNGQEGNYYALYSGKDANRDGIGDHGYGLSVSGNFSDYYPLMSPWLGDKKAPVIEVFSPNPDTTVVTREVLLNFTVNEAASETEYSLDGAANVTITGNATVPLSGLANGDHNIRVYATDLAGNEAAKTVHFTLEAPLVEASLVLPIAAAVAVAVAVAAIAFLLLRRRAQSRNLDENTL